MTAASPDPRGNSAQVLAAVLDGFLKLPQALAQRGHCFAEPRDRALLKALCFGVLRWLPHLDFLFRRLCARPEKADTEIRCLVLIGLHQLDGMENVPPHAAVSASVAACDSIGKPWARAFVNALLRRYLRERDGLLAAARADEVARHAHPRWLLDRLQAAYPSRWRGIAEQNNRQAPLFLRVNPLQTKRAAFLARLSQAGVRARACEGLPCAVEILDPAPVECLPGFPEGQFAVQDLSAQWAAAMLMDPIEADCGEGAWEGMRTLDACAAPGGKTAAVWEHCAGRLGELCAVESRPARFSLLEESLKRLRHVDQRLRLLNADACDAPSWWDRRPWDRILLDAPCSGSGIIRRHPDIKALRVPRHLDGLMALQRALLESCWAMLRPGGRLLYATCSVLPEENEGRIKAFMRDHGSDCRLVSARNAPQASSAFGMQILPGEQGMDGFFYALLQKEILS